VTRRLPALLALGALFGVRATAQTADSLARAQVLYDSLAIERAVPMLRAIISPSWSFDVSPTERATALEYLGAAFGLEDARDSAVAYFRAALQADPFADLDPRRFTPAQIAQFRRAQDLVFAVAARPVAPARLDPRVERAAFVVLTTHAATLDVSLRAPGGDVVTLLHGANAGPRDVTWDFLLASGALAPPGRYELAVRGESQVLTQADSARVYFDLAREGPGILDTLPSLAGGELLPVRYSARGLRADLARGLLVAGSALAVGGFVPNRALGGQRGPSLAIAGAALATAVLTVVARRHRPDLPANVMENVRRQAARASANAAIRQENAERLNHTVMVVAPATGTLP
jgi:hypothetical protein